MAGHCSVRSAPSGAFRRYRVGLDSRDRHDSDPMVERQLYSRVFETMGSHAIPQPARTTLQVDKR